MVELIRTYSKQYIITKHHDPNKTTRDHSNQRICSRDCMTSPFSNITFDNRVGVDHDHAMQNQNSTTKVDAHDINLTTSLRRTLSPVCQQNVKRYNKCGKRSWRVNISAAEQISLFFVPALTTPISTISAKKSKMLPKMHTCINH